MFSRSVRCPRCQEAALDTVVSAPYIRGLILGYTFGSKRFVGCQSCVRSQLAGEVGKSLLFGWFSLTGLLVNPILILWNTARIPFVKAQPEKVQGLLEELGVHTEKVDLPRVAASLAATMVAADGRVDPVEVDTATGLGSQLIDGFTPALFQDVMQNVNSLPSTSQLAGILCEVLDESGKVATLKYLLAIASADGTMDDAEIDELQTAARFLGVELPSS